METNQIRGRSRIGMVSNLASVEILFSPIMKHLAFCLSQAQRWVGAVGIILYQRLRCTNLSVASLWRTRLSNVNPLRLHLGKQEAIRPHTRSSQETHTKRTR